METHDINIRSVPTNQIVALDTRAEYVRQLIKLHTIMDTKDSFMNTFLYE